MRHPSDLPLLPGADRVSSGRTDTPRGSGCGRFLAHGGWHWRTQLVAGGVVTVVALVATWAQLQFTPNHDASWYLWAGRRLLEGADLYRTDILEINPPLIIVLSAGVVWVADLVRVDQHAALVLLVGLVCWASCLCSVCLVVPGRHSAQGFLGAVAAFAAITTWALLGIPGYDFGQREHLASALLLPYAALSASPQARRRWPAVEVVGAVAAGIACSLKPQFVLAFGAIELARAPVSPPRWRPLVIVLATGLSTLVATALMYPAYFTTIVPLARRAYPEYLQFVGDFVSLRSILLLGGSGLSLALLSRRTRMVWPWTFWWASVAGYAIYCLQTTGWPYHALVWKTFFGVTAGVITLMAFDAWTASNRKVGRSATVAGFLLVALLSSRVVFKAHRHQTTREFHDVAQLTATVRQWAPHGEHVAFLSPSLYPAFPSVLLGGARWGIRYPHLWTLSIAWKEETVGLSQLADDTRVAIAEDLETRVPAALFVDTRPYRPPLASGVDILAFFKRSPRFVRAFSHYRLVDRVGGFEVWVRRL